MRSDFKSAKSFDGKLRDKLLTDETLHSLKEAQIAIEQTRRSDRIRRSTMGRAVADIRGLCSPAR